MSFLAKSSSYFVFSHTDSRYTQPMETIFISANQLLSFLRMHYKQTMRSINLEEVQKLIREFELNKELRDKDLLSADGKSTFHNKTTEASSLLSKVSVICYYLNTLTSLAHFTLVKYIKT